MRHHVFRVGAFAVGLLPRPPSSTCATVSLASGPLSDARLVAASKIADATTQMATDRVILKGRVPTPEDWHEAWTDLTETLSLRKQSRMAMKRGASAIGDDGLRKRRRKMLRAQAEVIRCSLRETLRRATHISLALDESKYRKIIRFRCDRPWSIAEPLARHCSASGYVVVGVLLVLGAIQIRNRTGSILLHRKPPFRSIRRHPRFHVLPQGLDHAEPLCLGCRDFWPRQRAADGASKERRAMFMAARYFPTACNCYPRLRSRNPHRGEGTSAPRRPIR